MSIIPPAKRAHISSHFLDVKAGGGEDGEPPDAGEEEERGLDGDAAPYPAQSGHHGEEAHSLLKQSSKFELILLSREMRVENCLVCGRR